MTDKFVLAAIPTAFHEAWGDEELSRLERAHPRVRVDRVDSPERFVSLQPEADGVFGWNGFPIQAASLQPGARLRWVQTLGAGVDGLLTPELVAAEHVVVTSSKGPMAPAMAEHAAMLMLALARDLPGFLQAQSEKTWRWNTTKMDQLYQKTVAILGVGEVGGCLARICKVGFGMRVLGLARTRVDNPCVDRYFPREELPAALAEADVVALCLALTPATRHIINAVALAAMKPTALLVNVARGGLVDESALIEALRNGRLAGAGLDATAVEPLPVESPLWTVPRTIITPHVAPSRDPRVKVQLVDFWCENIRRFAEGEPLRGIVNRHEGY